MRSLRMRVQFVALGTTAALLTLTAGSCDDGASTGGTSGTSGGTSGGATQVGPSTAKPTISAAPGNCYKGDTVTLTIVGGYPLGEYTVNVWYPSQTQEEKTVKSQVLTTDEEGEASMKLVCDNLKKGSYRVTVTGTKDLAFFDVVRQ
jgi:hypothetical protein